MKAFEKINELIKRPPLSGHALANIQNRTTLARAKAELEEMLKVKKENGKNDKL